eukprot:5225582-Lingulodinium_polyedra.AAC.1
MPGRAERKDPARPGICAGRAEEQTREEPETALGRELPAPPRPRPPQNPTRPRNPPGSAPDAGP